MADPQIHWWDWHSWLYLTCGFIGLIIGCVIAIVAAILYIPIWIILKIILLFDNEF